MNMTTVGLDLVKIVLHVVCFNGAFNEVKKRAPGRNRMRHLFTQPPPCPIAMEACAKAHYWGRQLLKTMVSPTLHANNESPHEPILP